MRLPILRFSGIKPASNRYLPGYRGAGYGRYSAESCSPLPSEFKHVQHSPKRKPLSYKYFLTTPRGNTLAQSDRQNHKITKTHQSHPLVASSTEMKVIAQAEVWYPTDEEDQYEWSHTLIKLEHNNDIFQARSTNRLMKLEEIKISDL